MFAGASVLILLSAVVINTHTVLSQPSPDPQWATINVFHINPSHYGAAPINMNTGDVRGDMYCELTRWIVRCICAEADGCTVPWSVAHLNTLSRSTLQGTVH